VYPSGLLRESCAARAARPGSTFAAVGRGGLPAAPGIALGDYGFAARPDARMAALPLDADGCASPRG
jgi:hypothetical protein